MNEAMLIRYLRARSAKGAGLVTGIGDDAAVVKGSAGKEWLLKADMIVEGVHFAHGASERDCGRKAVMCNVSDIAAMGGVPRYALVSAGFPRGFSLARAKKVSGGVLDALKECGVLLVGGDTTRSERLILSVAMAGEVERGRAVLRSGARPGDILFVTGPLGGSLRSGRHLRFRPRLAESRHLVRRYDVHAMLDVSDGLAADLGHLARESGVGLRVFEAAVPLHRGVRSVERAFTDGEDFELVFAVSPRDASRLVCDEAAHKKGFRFHLIGRVVARKKGLKIVAPSGRERSFPPVADHHFGRRA